MRLSIWPTSAQPLDDLLATARHADATGWDTIYLFDHFMGDGGAFGAAKTPTFEATALLAGLATTTTSARLASLVFGTPYRHPAVLANWAVTVDHLSGGRRPRGGGAVCQVNESEQDGIG